MLRRYWPFFKADAMETVAYRFNIVGWLIVSTLQILCVFFLWIGVYANSPQSVINGFTLREMLVYTAFINVFNFVTFPGNTMYNVVHDITTGTIALSFVKPISYRLRFVFANLGGMCMNMLMLGLPLFTVLYAVFAVLGFISIAVWWMVPVHIALFFAAQLCAAMLFDCLDYICGVLCFYTTAGWGMNSMKQVIISFLSGSLVPLSFFPKRLSEVLSYSPFAGISQNPVLVLMMKMDWLSALLNIGIAVAWLVVLELLAKLIFSIASRKVTVQGG